MRAVLVIWLLGLCPTLLTAEINSLFPDSSIASSNAGLVPTDTSNSAVTRSASLFIGQEGSSFFRPFPVRVPATPQITGPVAFRAGGPVAYLRDLIAAAEAGPMGYDAVQHGARIRPSKPPTSMTINEIYAWIRATPGQPHAIGRYQFIPPTLRRLVRDQGVDPNQLFSPQVQDLLADALLAEAGIARFNAGSLSRHGFMNNLAKIWAGFPNSTGRSHYHGYAGNKATMTWARFDAEMRRIFPGRA